MYLTPTASNLNLRFKQKLNGSLDKEAQMGSEEYGFNWGFGATNTGGGFFLEQAKQKLYVCRSWLWKEVCLPESFK